MESNGTAQELTPIGDGRWTALAVRLRDLANGMIILAVAGLVYFCWLHAEDFRAIWGAWRLVRQEPRLVLVRIEPLEFVRVLWPLGLAVAFRLLRWPRLARAAAITFLVLAADRLLGAFLGYMAVRPASFLGTTGAVRPPATLSRRFWLALVGGIVLAVWAGTLGVRGVLVDWSYRRLVGRTIEPGGRRRWTLGRLGVLAALVFGLGLFYGRAWALYEEVLIVHPVLRQLVLKGEKVDPATRYQRLRLADPAAREVTELLGKSAELQARGNYRELHRIYPTLIDRFRKFSTGNRHMGDYYADLAMAANNLAWAMATSPDERARNPKRAVELAREAVGAVPYDGNTWNTLAVAYYRAGDRKQASHAFGRATGLRMGGDSFDWFFMAMIAQEEGLPDDALWWYERAAGWMEKNRPRDRELWRFRAEAAFCLGLDDPEAFAPPPVPPPTRRLGPANRPTSPD
jgi:hypothetical protein